MEVISERKIIIGLKQLMEGVNPPRRATEGSAGMDIESSENAVIKPFERVAICTGLAMEIPKGYEVQIRSRSGLALKHGVVVLNSPATIDSDYQGEIKVLLINLSNEDFQVTRGMRIAQIILGMVVPSDTEILNGEFALITGRGSGGFGSTGL